MITGYELYSDDRTDRTVGSEYSGFKGLSEFRKS